MKKSRILVLLLAFTMAAPALLHAQIIKGEVFVGGNGSQVYGDECYRYRKFGVHAGAGALIPITNFIDVGLEVLFSQKGAYKRDSINEHLGLYTGRYKLNLNYAEVPLMVYLTDKNNYSVGVGVSYGRIVGLKEYINDVSTGIQLGDGRLHWKENEDQLPDISGVKDINELSEIIYSSGFPESTPIEQLVPEVIDNSNSYRPNDFSLCLDVRIRVWEGFHAEVRYQQSLASIRTRLFYKDPAETILKTDDIRVQPLQLQYNNTLTFRLVYIFNEHRSKANKEAMKK